MIVLDPMHTEGPESIQALFRSLQEAGYVEPDRPIEELGEEDYKRIFANLGAPLSSIEPYVDVDVLFDEGDQGFEQFLNGAPNVDPPTPYHHHWPNAEHTPSTRYEDQVQELVSSLRRTHPHLFKFEGLPSSLSDSDSESISDESASGSFEMTDPPMTNFATNFEEEADVLNLLEPTDLSPMSIQDAEEWLTNFEEEAEVVRLLLPEELLQLEIQLMYGMGMDWSPCEPGRIEAIQEDFDLGVRGDSSDSPPRAEGGEGGEVTVAVPLHMPQPSRSYAHYSSVLNHDDSEA
ncbi:hypothetical protein MD484_g1477, partial [Candolleomyces efflorescens]